MAGCSEPDVAIAGPYPSLTLDGSISSGTKTPIPPKFTARKFALIFIILMLGLAALQRASSWRDADSNAEYLVTAIARTMEFQSDTTFRGIETLLREASQRIEPNHWPDPALVQWYSDRMKGFPEATSLIVLDDKGKSVGQGVGATGLTGQAIDASDRDYFAIHHDRPSSNNIVIGKPIVGRSSQRIVIPVSAAILDNDKHLKGIVLIGLNAEFLINTLKSLILEDAGGISLIRNDGIFLARLPDPDGTIGMSAASGSLFRNFLSQSKTGVARIVSITDGNEKIVAFRSLERFPLVATVGISKRTAFSVFWRDTIWIAVSVLGLAITLFIFATLSDKREHSRAELSEKLRLQSDILQEQVSELQIARTDLQQHTRELAETNADLEQVAYVASHDLQTPVRNIISYSQLLKKRYGGQLDADADDFIHYIVDYSGQMKRLIGSVLEYIRIGSNRNDVSVVNSGSALKEAIDNLSPEINELSAIVFAGEMPSVLAKQGLLVSIFQNLLGNALRYRAPDRLPQLSITATFVPTGLWQFDISDNGIGIGSEYHGKIFEIFQRLNPAISPEGTGVGLTMCRRIVRQFGGEMWLESSPGQGSTFSFTLRDGN
jgi:signal transduction histidine kinase